MSGSNNGTKMFLYVVQHTHDEPVGGRITSTYVIRSDHNPDAEELSKLLVLDYDDINHTLEALRYSEDEIPTLGPKQA